LLLNDTDHRPPSLLRTTSSVIIGRYSGAAEVITGMGEVIDRSAAVLSRPGEETPTDRDTATMTVIVRPSRQ
jgi:hypothetical protein